MSRFSIRDLEQLSGIKAHTIRVWEQRYGIITPKRTQTNIRYYDDEALKLILNVALLNEHGFKISKIARMGNGEMKQEVLKITEEVTSFTDQVHALTIAMVDLNEDRFEKILSSNTIKLGFEETMLKIIFPFLTKIGILWQTGAVIPAQEHFISNLVRQKLIVAIDGQYERPAENACKFLLFLPEGELHEMTLLFADLVIKSRKGKSIYLGQSLPLKDLRSVYEWYRPDYILSVITSTPGPADVQKYVEHLSQSFPDSQIFLSGLQVVGQGIEEPENVEVFTRFDQLIKLVEEEMRRAS